MIKTYDGLNKKIIDSSYPNLAPNKLTYAYGGPLITINNDETVVIRSGVMSEAIPISLAYPSALNITITPNSINLSVEPFTIDFSIGDLV